jgi:hypothetical protein
MSPISITIAEFGGDWQYQTTGETAGPTTHLRNIRL